MFEEDWPTLETFLGLRWDVDPWSGRALGVHYPQLEATLRMVAATRAARREMFADLQAMERAALAEFGSSSHE